MAYNSGRGIPSLLGITHRFERNRSGALILAQLSGGIKLGARKFTLVVAKSACQCNRTLLDIAKNRLNLELDHIFVQTEGVATRLVQTGGIATPENRTKKVRLEKRKKVH